MTFSRTILMVGLLLVPVAGYGWQTGGDGAAARQDAPASSQQEVPLGKPGAAAAVPASSPSSLLKPTLDALKQTVDSLKLEKWKGGTVRSEAASNIASIQKDVETTLPPMLEDADGAPVTMGKLLPVSRNIDALYAVLLRVVDGSRVAAPGDQVGQLQQTIADLEKARRAFDMRIEDMAAAQEKQIADLQTALKNPVVPACPAVAVAPAKPAVTPAHKVVKKKKPATAPANAPPAAAAKPN